MKLAEIRHYLQSIADAPIDRDSGHIQQALADIKKAAVARDDQDEAKEVWRLESALAAQEHYLAAYRYLKNDEFYKAWRELARVEVVTLSLERHLDLGDDPYRVSTIKNLTLQYQEIYPYTVFFSVELVEKAKECSICHRPVSLRNPCGHRVGEIYDGEMSVRIVTDMELISVSCVQHPMMKETVPFLEDGDHYDYSMVRALVEKLEAPLQSWSFETVEHRVKPGGVGRNDPCPCGSGKKFKKCCLPEGGVVAYQYQFQLDRPPRVLPGGESSKQTQGPRPLG